MTTWYVTALLGPVLIVRLACWFRPFRGPTVFGFRIHHGQTGLGLVVIGVLLVTAHGTDAPGVYLTLAGVGLFHDECYQLMTKKWTYADYWSKPNVITAAVGIAVQLTLLGIGAK